MARKLGRSLRTITAAGATLAAAGALTACSSSSSNAGGPKFSSNGQYFYVAPEHAGFSSPQMASGDALAWSLHRQGTFAPAGGTAFADAPVE